MAPCCLCGSYGSVQTLCIWLFHLARQIMHHSCDISFACMPGRTVRRLHAGVCNCHAPGLYLAAHHLANQVCLLHGVRQHVSRTTRWHTTGSAQFCVCITRAWHVGKVCLVERTEHACAHHCGGVAGTRITPYDTGAGAGAAASTTTWKALCVRNSSNVCTATTTMISQCLYC
jgi:hypothetical protein